MPYTYGLRSGGFPRYGTVMNVILAPLNLMKTFNLRVPPAQADSNGYPTSTLGSAVGSQGSVPSNYYGQYVWKWSGAASMTANGSPAIVYSSANCTLPGLSNNCVGNNFTITNATAGINPRVVFKYGSLISSVSGGNGSPVVLTLINSPAAFNIGNSIKIGVGVSAGLAAGPNSDGSWTISGSSLGQITLANSTGVTSPTVTGTGGPGVQSEAVIDNAAVALFLNSGATFSSFTALVYCQAANESAINAGQLVDPAYVVQLQALKPAWLRFMDMSGVQGSWETDFAARTLPSYITWPGSAGWFNSNYWVGTVHNSGSDAYTCSAPSLTNTGAYHNGEVVQGTVDITNSGGTPTLNVNGRGAKKIITNGAPFDINFPNPAASAGQSMQYTFSASWFNGNVPYVFTYTTTTTGHFGDDTASSSILRANVSFAMNLDATLLGNFAATNSGGVSIYPKTPQAGVPTITYSGPVTSTIVTLQPSFFTASGNYVFMYSYVLDAWQVKGGGLIQSIPLEYMISLCNSVGASMWYTWPINTSSAYVTAFTNFVGDSTTGLTSGLRFGTELGNEMWNFGAQPWGFAFSYGFALGLELQALNQNGASYSWTGAKTKQFYTASSAAWTGKGRTASQHYALLMSAEFDVANTNTWEWGGKDLDAIGNTTYGTYGGVDGVAGSTNAASSYNVFPNRPIDIVPSAVGVAPYWGSDFLSGDTGGAGFITNTLTGTVLQNAPLLSASLQYAQGSTSAAYTALFGQFYEVVSAGGPAGGLNLLRDYKNSVYQQIETVLRGYDSGRTPVAVLHYEAGPQFGLGNINNGTNSPTADIAAVATHITNNGWDVSPYVVSATNNATECATNLCGMVYNFKFSTQFYNLYRNYFLDVTYVHSGRECCGSQYGYSQNQWGLFPGNWAVGIPSAYSSFQATADFNAGL